MPYEIPSVSNVSFSFFRYVKGSYWHVRVLFFFPAVFCSVSIPLFSAFFGKCQVRSNRPFKKPKKHFGNRKLSALLIGTILRQIIFHLKPSAYRLVRKSDEGIDDCAPSEEDDPV